MKVLNLLEFLNNANTIIAPDFITCESTLVNFLKLISLEEQFTQKFDVGVLFANQKTLHNYVIIDGLNRLLSLSLLLHAVCECYKKTTSKNESAIRTIRKKYLLNGTASKLKLPKEMQIIYEKIIYGERLSGKEKLHPMFVLLHNYWSQIKEQKLQASSIFKMLQKLSFIYVETDDVEKRDLYYSLNKDKRELNQLLLISDYLNLSETKDLWIQIQGIFNNNYDDIVLFFKDFFQNKFNYITFDKNLLYVYFLNYFETMKKYSKPTEIIQKINKSAILYNDILNVKFFDNDIKKAVVRLKMHNCDDTYAYLLNVYEDYTEGNISKEILLEILSAIEEYLINREQTPNNMNFNELIKYLNTYFACK